MNALALTCCLLLAPQAELRYDPTENYQPRKIEGFRVYVNKRLLREKKDLSKRALALLRVKLYDINRVVPEPALQQLHKVRIWMEIEDERHPCACYHPSREWLKENGYNPEKAGSVDIANAANFLTWTRDQPYMVLHELAHAYHHQVLGYDNPDIKEAYKRAVEGGSYESVLRAHGKMARAYALNNDQEYFAELTEAFFGTNDFYPFVRAEVFQHDPFMYETLKKLWKEVPGD
ncbi:MAG: hypothetical protein ACE5R4_14125 [Armatimonadota bacterium]